MDGWVFLRMGGWCKDGWRKENGFQWGAPSLRNPSVVQEERRQIATRINLLLPSYWSRRSICPGHVTSPVYRSPLCSHN